MFASKRQVGLALIIIFVFSALAWVLQVRSGTNEYRWYSILPPVFAVACAIATRQLLLSLSAGVISGALLINVPAAPLQLGSWLGSVVTVLMQLWNVISDPFNLSVLAFIILMLIMISVVILSGGLLAIMSWLERFAQGPRSTQFVTTLMGFLVFIDDYANVMIVGSSMRPISDAMKISREKLAFLVDATSAPVAGIALMSTWIGYEVGIFAEVSSSLGFNRDAYSMFLDALSFRFYCIFMILFIMINVWSGREFGSMLKAERRSRAGAIVAKDAVLPTKVENEVKPDEQAIIRASTALLPIGVLFFILFAGLWVDGGGLVLLSESMGTLLSFTAWRNVISASDNNVQVLIVAGAFSLLTAFVCTLLLARLSFESHCPCSQKRCQIRFIPWLILILAWSLGGSASKSRQDHFWWLLPAKRFQHLSIPDRVCTECSGSHGNRDILGHHGHFHSHHFTVGFSVGWRELRANYCDESCGST